MSKTVKKEETPIEQQENWLQSAFNHVPLGEVDTKVNAILNACGTSLQTFYRWKASGHVPGKANRNLICGILGVDPSTVNFNG